MDPRKIRTGVIGAGIISTIYLKNMMQLFDNLDVCKISSRGMESARKQAEAFGITACTTEEILTDPEIEMVVILTPACNHYDLIRQALEQGKHVYTEKTIADSPEKAAELLALADEKGLYLASAPDTFLGSSLQAARAAIDDGILGDIHSFAISTTRCNDLLESVLSFLRQPGGGFVYDYGVYYVTALVSLFGPVQRAGGFVKGPILSRKNIVPGSPGYGEVMDTPNDSIAAAVLELENGIFGTLHMNAESLLRDEAYFTIYGTRGILTLSCPNDFSGKIRFEPVPRAFGVPAEPVTLWEFTPFSENSRGIGPSDLASAIIDDRPPRASKEMAAHVLEVLTAILDQKGIVEIHSTCTRPEPLPQKPLGALSVTPFAISIRNTLNMRNFYTKGLGLDAPLIQLIEQPSAIQSSETRTVRIKVKDMTQAYAAAQWNGLRPEGDASSFYLTDPDGNRVEVYV